MRRDAANAALKNADIDPEKFGLELVEGTCVEDEDCMNDDKLRQVIERFRRALAVTEASVARFIVGGNLLQEEGRNVGLVEEVVLSLALKRPVYLAGGFGGATAEIGKMLGLAPVRTGVAPKLMESQPNDEQENLAKIRKQLQAPPLRALPVLQTEQIDFLQKHALGGNRWPQNGLTPEENRKLFQCDEVDTVARMVVRGLSRHFASLDLSK